MDASHKAIVKENSGPGAAHNIKSTDAFIQQCFKDLSEIDAKRKELNDAAAKMRESLKNMGIDPKAFHDQYMRAKKRRKQKEGYDESVSICLDALNKMDQPELFAWMEKPQKELEEKQAPKAKKKDGIPGPELASIMGGGNA